MTTVNGAVRRCKEKGCRSAAMTRRGTTGPHPKRCEEHTAERKRQINHHPIKPKVERSECCDPDHLCEQHEQQRDELRDQAAKELARDSAFRIFGLLDAELKQAGIQITLPDDPKFWRTHYGPWEGRTAKEVFNRDLKADNDARAFYAADSAWHKDANQAGAEWPPMWESCLPPHLFLALFCAALEGEKFRETNGRYSYELAS
jgi:hypothetical protein